MKMIKILFCLFISITVVFSQPITFSTLYGNGSLDQSAIIQDINGTGNPGGRRSHAMVLFSNNSVLLFGGYQKTGLSNDLWRFVPSESRWYFVFGNLTSNVPGNYDTSGNGYPSSRSHHTMVLLTNNSIVTYGGNGVHPNGSVQGTLNDLWRFEPSESRWYFIIGHLDTFIRPNYTSDGYPGSRQRYTMTNLYNDTILLFGGENSGQLYNDIWTIDAKIPSWRFISGSQINNTLGVYDNFGNGYPGARKDHAMVLLPNRTIIIYGGQGYGSSSLGYLNDLWRFDIDLNRWYFVKGNKNINTDADYSFNGDPGSRLTRILYFNNSIFLFGGIGYTSLYLNDIWRFSIKESQWNFISGNVTNNINGNYNQTKYPGSKGAQTIVLLNYTFIEFGGYGFGSSSSSQGFLDDVWSIEIQGKCYQNPCYCLSGFFGRDCDQKCMCLNGICDEGINGTGKCITCDPGLFGDYCNITCSCQNGKCQQDGSCQCADGYRGLNCSQRCIDSQCTLLCECGTECGSNSSKCFNDISISDYNTSITENVNFHNNVSINSSSIFISNVSVTITESLFVNQSFLNLTSTNIKIEQGMILNSSKIYMLNSTITINNCLLIENTTIVVDLKQFNKSNAQQATLILFSTNGCKQPKNIKYEFLNEDTCFKAKVEETSSSISLFLASPCGGINKENNGGLSSSDIIIIIVCSCVLVAVILTIVVLSNPKIKRKIFTIKKI